MKHLLAFVFIFLGVVVGLAFVAAGLWPIVHGGSASVMLSVIGVGCLVFAACLAIPADVDVALKTASPLMPLLNRVPMPAIARQTIATRMSQAIAAIPEEK